MKAGDKVVCVDDSVCRTCGQPSGVTRGRVYVVKQAIRLRSGRTGLFIVGATPMCEQNGPPAIYAFSIDRFRKLDEIKSELAALMGETKRHPVAVTAQ